MQTLCLCQDHQAQAAAMRRALSIGSLWQWNSQFETISNLTADLSIGCQTDIGNGRPHISQESLRSVSALCRWHNGRHRRHVEPHIAVSTWSLLIQNEEIKHGLSTSWRSSSWHTNTHAYTHMQQNDQIEADWSNTLYRPASNTPKQESKHRLPVLERSLRAEHTPCSWCASARSHEMHRPHSCHTMHIRRSCVRIEHDVQRWRVSPLRTA